MKRVLVTMMALMGVVAQMSLLPALRPFGVVPNVVLVLVVLVGLEGPASLTLVIAVLGGLALDLASGANFGLWMGVLVLAALAAGLLRRAGVELAGGTVAGVMVVAGTVLMAVVVLVGLAPTAISWPAGLLVGRLFTELVLNLLLIVILRPLVRRVVPSASPDEMAAG